MKYCNIGQHFCKLYKGLAFQKNSTPRSVSLPRVRLRAVLDNFGFANISISDSAQC